MDKICIICQLSYSSKNPYGNKTNHLIQYDNNSSYSSKNPYGNKTIVNNEEIQVVSYSSKNPYGNKTKKSFKL